MFVAAILVLSDAVAHLEPPNRVIWVVAVFVALWCVWLQTTLFTNVFRVQDMTHQILVLTQMFVVILVTMEAHEGVVHDAIALSLSYGALIAIVAIMYWRSARDGGAGERYAATRSYFLIASAVVFGVAAAVPVVRGLVWIVALAELRPVPLATAVGRRSHSGSRREPPRRTDGCAHDHRVR